MKSNPTNRFRSARAGALTTLIMLPMASSVIAADRTWSGLGADNNWTTSANWNAALAAADRPIFAGSTRLTPVNDFAADTSFAGIQFGGTTTGAFTLTGNRITLGGNTTFAGNPTNPIIQTINFDMLLSGDRTVTTQTNGAVTVGGIIDDGASSFGITKSGAGTLTLTGLNTFDGQVTISRGVLAVNRIENAGTASSLGDATDTNSIIVLGVATNEGILSYIGTTAASTDRQIRVNTGPGTISHSAVDPNHTLVFTNPTFNAQATSAQTLTLQGTNTGNNEVQGIVQDNSGGAISLTKASGGKWIVSGANTFSGLAFIDDGILSVNTLANAGTASSLGTGNTIPTIQFGTGVRTGTLDYTGATTGTNRQIQIGSSNATHTGGGIIQNNSNSGVLTFSNAAFNFPVVLAANAVTRILTLSGSNTGLNTITGVIADNVSTNGGIVRLRKEGVGTWVLEGANTYSGSTTITGGTLQIGAGGTTGALGGGAVTNNGALVFDRSDNVAFSNVISGSGSLTKNSAGTLTSSAVNTFTGPITINGGTLEFTATDGGNKVFGSTQININGASTLKVSGTVANIPIFKATNYTFDSAGGGKIELGAGGNYDAGVANEPFSITTQGGAQNTIKIIDDGVSGANGFNLGPGTTVATFNVALGADATSDLTVTPIMSNGGSVLKTGTGRLTLAGANTYGGSTTVTGGTLTLGASGVIPDASPVSLGAATLNAATTGTETTGTLDVTAAATINLGAGAKLVFTSGTATWAGTLNITGAFVSGSSLNFGIGGLSPAQLGAITLNGGGGPFTLDGSGFLTGGVSGFAAWQSANSTAQAANLDHDNDGVSNGVEHFLGGIGNTTGNSNPLPSVINTAGTLSVTWVRHPDFPGFPANYGTGFLVETSATLANPWTAAVQGIGAGFVEITGNNVKYTFPAGTKNFARLKVVAP